MRKQGIFWIITIPARDYTVPTELPLALTWIKGQKEVGDSTGYEHYQITCSFRKKVSRKSCHRFFGKSSHVELSKSRESSEYVWKEDTAVEGTRFEFGVMPICRNSRTDWELVWVSAQEGNLQAVPANIRTVHFRTLQRIASTYDRPRDLDADREVFVYYGTTRTGKSRRARAESINAFSKMPNTKFWCGYQGEEDIILDEFRGEIGICHLLRWFDRYGLRVETKGGFVTMKARRFWITSNLPPERWYPEVDQETFAALKARFTKVIHFRSIDDLVDLS